MHRVDATNHYNNTFTDGNAQTGIAPTTLAADWHNSVQEEIANVVEFTGDTLDRSDNTQLLTNLIPHVGGMTALRAIAPVSGYRVYLKYHTTAGDGGHGVFRGVTGASAATYTHNGGTILVPSGGDGSAAWLREYSGAVNVRWFGATGDGATDDTASIDAAVSSGSGIVYLPTGTYLVSSLSSISSNVGLWGDGPRKSIIKTSATTGDVLTLAGTWNTLYGVGFTCASARTSGAYVKISGNYATVRDVVMEYGYLGVENTGTLNNCDNVQINLITSRATAADSGGILNTSGILKLTNCIVSSGITSPTSDFAEYAFKFVVGELDMTQCFGFLCNTGVDVVPGNSQTANGLAMHKCWLDSMLTYGVRLAPSATASVISPVFISDSWVSCGYGSTSGYGIIADCSAGAGAVIGNVTLTGNYIFSYYDQHGYGVYVNAPNTAAYVHMAGNEVGAFGGSGWLEAVNIVAATVVALTGNSFNGNSVGVRAQSSTGHFGCTGNIFYQNTTPIIDSSSYTRTITDNTGTWFGTATYNPANLVDGDGVSTTVTVTGAILGDSARATFDLDLQGITLTAYVSAADTVTVRFQNETGGAIDLGNGSIRAWIERRR